VYLKLEMKDSRHLILQSDLIVAVMVTVNKRIIKIWMLSEDSATRIPNTDYNRRQLNQLNINIK